MEGTDFENPIIKRECLHGIARLSEAVVKEYRSLPKFDHIRTGWTTDIRRIPEMTLENVKFYLISSNDRTFDREAMRAYKALKAYKLWDAGHVHSIEINVKYSQTFCIVKASVNASQRSGVAYMYGLF